MNAQGGISSSPQLKRAESLYQRHCESCHGRDLNGSEGGPALTGAEFDTAWNGQKLSMLFRRIKGSMPQAAPGSLSDQQYADVLALILTRNGASNGDAELSAEFTTLNTLTYTARAR